MAASAVRRPRPRGAFRRGQILEAATQVFLDNGYAGATIDLVVERPRASKGSICNFFGDKEGLFAAIIEECTERLMKAFLTIDAKNTDVPNSLAQIARRYLEITLAPDVTGIYRLMLAEGGRIPELARTFYRLGRDRLIDHMAGIFDRWRARGLIEVEDPALMAGQFLDAAASDLQLRAVAGLSSDDRAAVVERNVQHAVKIFSSALIYRSRKP